MKTAPVALVAFALSAVPAAAEIRVYDVAAFDSVSVSAGIAAVIVVGGAQSVVADAANAAVLERLKVEVRGTKLDIGIEWNLLDFLLNLGQHRQITVNVGAPRVGAVSASSGADVDVTGMNGDGLSLDASSGASLVVKGVAGTDVRLNASSGAGLDASGTCDRLFADASSGANVDARGLICKRVDANASSGGHASVFASEAADAEASSGGGVSILGNALQVDRETSSGGGVDIVP